MSVQIKVSYETEAELRDIVQRLQRPGMKVKQAEQKGQYRRAYIRIGESTVDDSKNSRYNVR